ncbi:C6 zinc finger protein [Paraphaeosphaeria minitans]|uniref:C6 zinc finger protein n=1 Tax=Paraphaeosphaeria minitans TaxID=565426 RepID=A0A9P6KIU9_9PLEO|nr:C6 zinc finger protein [Paraphaeosphaeria minitans]
MTPGQGKRASHQRSKEGCDTCRQRRIKCDETHPTCMRCIKAILHCNYTATFKVTSPIDVSSNGRRAARVLLPKRDDVSSLTTLRPTATLPGETDVENQYLKYFHQETTSGFPSTWDWSVWNRLMLQGCHHKAFIRDAVVAIGALHKSLRTSAMASSNRKSTEELVKLQRQFAYQTYGRALKKIQHAINTGSGPRDALIACLLIVCFESHTGDRYKAGIHAQHGLRIYHQLPLKERPSEVEDDIADAFRNLDIAISTVYDDRPVETHEALLDEDAYIATAMPLVFATLDEAKRYWHVIMRRCCHFIPTTWAHSSPSSLTHPFQRPIPGSFTTTVGTNIHTASFRITPGLEAQQRAYYAEMCRWILAFAPVLARIRRSTTSTLRDYVTASMLQIQALNGKVMLAGILYVDEMGYDDHLSDFTSIVSLSHDILRIRNAGSSTSYFSGLFVLDLGLIVPLFTLLLKCRDGVLRHQSIEILKQWHVEGWWDPLIIIAICKCIIHVEEEEMVGGMILAQARATLTGKCHRPPERKMLVQCVQRRKEGLRWVERLVEW